MAWTRTKQETLALSINALALLILQDDIASGGWNWQKWMRDSEQHGTGRGQGDQQSAGGGPGVVDDTWPRRE
jgi:hypothetical protein